MRCNGLMALLCAGGILWVASGESLGQGGKKKKTGEINTPPAFSERKITKLKVGDPAPDFTLPDVKKKSTQVRLSSFQGKKPVVLIFGSYT